MDDDELIASLAGGDDMALRQLFDRHAPWLAARLRKALPPAVGLAAFTLGGARTRLAEDG